jgi:anaerobic magnesium-protoporphyrin IX monomethyl ester cyclase
MTQVILINPPTFCIDDDRLEPQLGLLYIASVLKSKNIPVQIFEMTGCKNEYDLKKKLREIPEGDIFGFTVYCTNYRYAKQCADYIRSTRDKPYIVFGGPNPTALPEFTLQDSGCDCVITGEGEDAFAGFVRAVENNSGFPSIIHGTGRNDLDTYPLPAWDLVDLNTYTRMLEGQRVISILSSRGCKYHCAHCNSIIMGGGTKVRYRSAEKIVEEMNLLIAKGFRKFRFNDDNFTGNPDLPKLLSMIKCLGISFRIFARIEDLTEDTCQMLAESGCRHISVGLETLNPDNLRILGKLNQAGCEAEHVSNAKRSGMILRTYFMIGLPFDTDETVRRYFEEANRLPFDEFSLYPLIPYPGTRIANEPGKFGYEIVDRDFTRYIQIGKNKTTTYALRHKNFTERDVQHWYTYVEELFLSSGKRLQSQSTIAL